MPVPDPFSWVRVNGGNAGLKRTSEGGVTRLCKLMEVAEWISGPRQKSATYLV